MHDPNFEKTVQQKMAELQFLPAESVWVNIEKAVAGQSRRRGLPYFWRFALPVMVAAAVTGGYYFVTTRPANRMVSNVENQGAPKQLSPAASGSGAEPVANGHIHSATSIESIHSATSMESIKSATSDERTAAAVVSNESAAAASKTSATLSYPATRLGASQEKTKIGQNGVGDDRLRNVRSGRDWAKATRGSGTSAKAGDPAFDDASAGKAWGSGVTQGSEQTTAAVTSMTATPTQAASRKVWFFQPGLADQRQIQAIRAAQLNKNSKKAAISIATLQKKSRPWEAGFVAGGGISRLNRLNSDQAAAAVSYTAASFYRINGSSQGKAYISDIRSDAAFSGGVYLQKAISDRWIFNTGMTLNYYSNGITIGQEIKTYVQASASFLNPSLATVPSAAVYSAGNQQSYTNRYYLLELPLNIQWKINKNHLLPLFLEGGVSLARLMSANALLYDSKTGVYSKQGNQINKTQLYTSTALMAGLSLHGLHIEVGPQVQYGLTPIVNGQSLGNQHFFYTGIKLVVIPGKK